ncbi:hypothetical protein [Lactobacillus xylocopicola]|uniref:Uncharacterized protein n=1 Tax=Lactobacillus xylocopicola TaxID=2976676 RepID=A0ABM8BF61_9LACO|nr:hypothetical protein [Lactobacillus xylocopicola]BDR59875.1 hypothetical protein KIM322_01360 [Lactobacillus xylocopicola]
MANGVRDGLHRVSQEQNSQYKTTLTFLIYLLVTLLMITATFLNPPFMKRQIRTSNNEAVVVRQVNKHFNTLANTIGASQSSNANLLTSKQTQPIADHIIDYALGFPWIKVNNTKLARQILHDINLYIDQGSSSDAQLVQEKLKEQGSNALYEVVDAFSLNTMMIGGNIAFILLLGNLTIIVMVALSLKSLLSEMRMVMNGKRLLHNITAAGMWAGFWVILIAGLLALFPVIFNITGLAVLGYVLEIASSIFLDFVIVGVILYIVMAIPWEISSPNN